MNDTPAPQPHSDDAIDFSELLARLRLGLLPSLGLAALGLALGSLAYLASGPYQSVTTSSRVSFSFTGFEKGEYPDKSRFQSDDLRAPDVVSEALKRQQLEVGEAAQGRIRAALNIEGIIPGAIIKERDKLRASGQALRPYIPDEYEISLTLPRKSPLAVQQREQLLNEIINVYREKFQRTYADLPLAFGNAFATLDGADFYEYELILNLENQNIEAYLRQMADTARAFRSPATNLSFTDLHKQARLFAQVRLNETLGLIRQHGITKDRPTALIKMDYSIRTLEDQESRAIEEEKLIRNLLHDTQQRQHGYVLGVKSQASQARPEGPILDQGLIDSLLANDAYNFLVRQALDAGLKVKAIQSEKAVLMERRQNLNSFKDQTTADQKAITEILEKSVGNLKSSYLALVETIRLTHKDYQAQRFNDTVRITMQPVTAGFYRSLAMAGIAGLGIGLAAGIGLSLLNLIPGRKQS